jgi:hypothetical protein
VSRGNILSQGFVSRSAYHVTFDTRSGPRTYQYDGDSGIAIAAGADPHDFNGEEVGAMSFAQNLAEDLEDLAEIGEIAAL